MCGIAGIVALERGRRVDLDVVRLMINALVHRGPDDCDHWLSPDGDVGLGHRRLSIVDLSSAGRQPMANADGSVVVNYNGEIYNYKTLRADLQRGGHRFRSATDTECILHLYSEKGPDLLADLEGDYALAIWDQRRRELFLARDRAGVKPLYYSVTGGYLLFASEVRALLASGMIARELNLASLYHYLSFLASPPGSALVRGVEKLEVGSAMLVRSGSSDLRKWRYWEPMPGRVEIGGRDLDEQLAALFEDSVSKRSMADVPVGVLFSGGVDSTINAVTFQKSTAPRNVRTFTVGMPGSQIDESGQAAKMARIIGTEHHEVLIDDATVLNDLEMLTRAQDEPVSDPVSLPLFYVSRLARESGTVVLQAGEGADEIFCGYSKYLKFARTHEWESHPVVRAAGLILSPFYDGLGRRSGAYPSCVKIIEALRRVSLRQDVFMSSAVAYYELEKRKLLSPVYLEAVNGIDSYDVVRSLRQRVEDANPEASYLQKMVFMELNLRLPELLLMRVDKMSMANSIEVRVPFLDHRLIEFALSVPDDFKVRNGIPKEPIKRLAAQFVDRKCIYAPKRGFGFPIQRLIKSTMVEALFRDLLNDRSSVATDFFDRATILNKLERGPTTVNEGFKLWVVFNFLLWNKLVLQ